MLGFSVVSLVVGVVAVAVCHRLGKDKLWAIIGGRPNSNPGKKEGLSLCRELVTAAIVAAGSLVGLGALKGEPIDSAALIAYFIVNVPIILGLLAMCHLKEHDEANAGSERRHYFDRASKTTAQCALGLVVLFVTLVLLGRNALPFQAEEKPVRVVEAMPYLFSDGTQGVQALAVISAADFGRELPDRLAMKLQFLNGNQESWEISGASTAFLGDVEEVLSLARREETAKYEAMQNRSVEEFQELVFATYLTDDLSIRELGNTVSENPASRIPNPIFPQYKAGADSVVVVLPKPPSVEPVVLQVRLAPRGDEGVLVEEAISQIRDGRLLRLTYLNDN